VNVSRSCSIPLITSQYETLRRAALGEALLPEARGGLMLFLYRGMWGWARTLQPATVPRQPLPTLCPSPAEACERSTMIHLFAALAMHPHERRAP
jgi:hypothetical protein